MNEKVTCTQCKGKGKRVGLSGMLRKCEMCKGKKFIKVEKRKIHDPIVKADDYRKIKKAVKNVIEKRILIDANIEKEKK